MRLTGTTGSSITLVGALVMLCAGLVALLLANSLRGQLQEAQGQLQDTRSELQKVQEAKDRQQSIVNKNRPQDSAKDRSQNPKSSAQEGQDQQPQEDGGSSLS